MFTLPEISTIRNSFWAFLAYLAINENSSLKLRGLYSNSRKCGSETDDFLLIPGEEQLPWEWEIWTRRVENSGLLERKAGGSRHREYGGTRRWEGFIVEGGRIPKKLLIFQKFTRSPHSPSGSAS